MNIKEFYLNNYPTDELGIELRDDTNFTGLLNNLYTANDVYTYIGVGDSIIRERLFAKLAEILDAPYDYVYNLWLSN
jgi:hypothetical protein